MPQRLPYHVARIERTLRERHGKTAPLPLEEVLKACPAMDERVKARVLYNADGILKTEFQPYRMRLLKSLQLVDGNEADYRYKSADRSLFERLLALKGVCDDVLIVRNGLLTDTSYTNIALYDGCQWFTPATPLLEGTMRASLLDSGMLIEKDILLSDLPHHQYIALFNAMIDMGELVLPISCIHTKEQSLSV